MQIIYIDVLLALNLFIDFLLLSVTARLLHRPFRRWRMVLGAAFGAGCSCLIFLPEMAAWVSVVIKLAAAACIIKLTFSWAGIGQFLKESLVFFVASTVFAGLAFAVWFFAAPEGFYVVNGVVYFDVPPLMLVLLTVCSYGLLWLYDRFTNKKTALGCEYRLLVAFGTESASLKALYDTGNHLTETFSGSPVAVVSRSAVEDILPQAVLDTMRLAENRWQGETDAARGSAMRLVPYRSVGGDGLLPAFKPDKMTLVSAAGICRDVTGAYIALCENLGSGGYEALIGSDMAVLAADTVPGIPQETTERRDGYGKG